jgi:hypothetical protein
MTFVPRNSISRRRWTAVISLMPVGILLLFQNCGHGPSSNPASSYLSPRSPFYDARVRFDTPKANEAKTDTPMQQNPEKLSLLIHNGCAAERCAKKQGASIACALWEKSKHEKLKNDLQSYEWMPSENLSASAVEQRFSESPEDNACIAGASKAQVYKIQAITINDAQRGLQYFHETIKSTEALEYFSGQVLHRVRVGMVDSGVDITHQEIQFRANNSNLSDDCTNICNYHGTFVAGIIMAAMNNTFGGRGVAQSKLEGGAIGSNVELFSYQVGDDQGRMTTSEVVNAIRMAGIHKVEILNLSLGGSDTLDFSYQDALVEAMDDGMVVVVAAGNSGENLEKSPVYPASFNYDSQINVGSASPMAVSDTMDPPYLVTGSPIKRDYFSNYGRSVVHLAAPGRRIFSTTPGNGYAVASGTSFSTPMVTAAVALSKGLLKQKGVTASPSLLKQVLLEGSRSEATLNEMIDGRMTEAFEQNRYLDMMKLKDTLVSLAAIITANPSRIELVSSEAMGPANARTVRVRLRISDADIARGMRIRAYTNRQFLTDSYTGLECQVTSSPFFCDFDISYSRLLIDPEVYFQAIDSSGTVFSDLSIPKTALNFGVRADSNLAGEIVAVVHSGRTIKVEGWACLIGFPDKLKIEVRANTMSGAPVATLTTHQQGRGNYFTTCNSAEISVGFEYFIPTYMYSVGAPVNFYFRAVHEVTGKALNLRVLKYQPGYMDPMPATYADAVYVDPAISDTKPVVTITKREFKDWILTLEGSACYRNSRKPASFTVGLFQSEVLALFPKLWDENGIPSTDSKVSVAAAVIEANGASWNVPNPNKRTIDRAGYGFKRSPMFSEIHWPFSLADGGPISKTLLSVDDDFWTAYGLATINPSIDRADGCAVPSGFSLNIDIRPYIRLVYAYYGISYNKAVYSSPDDLVAKNGADIYLKLRGTPAPQFSEMRFKSRAFRPSLLFQQSFYEMDLYSNLHGFIADRNFIPANTPRFRTVQELRVPLVQHDYRDIRYSNRGWSNSGSFGGATRAPDSMSWSGQINTVLTKSNATALSIVYQSGTILLTRPQSTNLKLILDIDQGTMFGELGVDFVVDFLDPLNNLWYELPLDQYSSPKKGEQVLAADIDHIRALDQTQIRIRANGKNDFRIKKIGFMTE